MLKDGLVLIWELDVNLELTLFFMDHPVYTFIRDERVLRFSKKLMTFQNNQKEIIQLTTLSNFIFMIVLFHKLVILTFKNKDVSPCEIGLRSRVHVSVN